MGSVTWGQPILGGERQPWETGRHKIWPYSDRKGLERSGIPHMHIAHLQPCPSLPAGTASCLPARAAEGRTGAGRPPGQSSYLAILSRATKRPHSCNPERSSTRSGDTTPRLVFSRAGQKFRAMWKLGTSGMNPRDPQRHAGLLGQLAEKEEGGAPSNPDSAPLSVEGLKSQADPEPASLRDGN